MLLISFLIFLKTLLFIKITEIEHNIFLVFFLSISISLFVISWIYSKKQERRKFYIGMFYTIISIILFMDILYYSHFNTLPSITMLGQLTLLPSVSSSVTSLIDFKSLFLLADLPLVYFYINKRLNDIDGLLPIKLSKKIPLILFVFVLFFLGYSNVAGLTNSLKYQEPYSYHLTDIVNKIKARNDIENLDKKINEDLIKDLRDRASYHDGYLTGLAKGRNLIVIQVESLQNFVVGLNYNNQEVTPNLNKLIQDKSTIYYNNYFHVTARGNTSDAEFVSNNSLYPAKDAPTYSKYENNDFYGLPWVLRDNGYKTMAFHGFDKDFWNRDKAYLKQGFQDFYSREDYNYDERIILGIGDKEFFKQNVEILKKYRDLNDEPFYAFMVTLSSHTPFKMPEKYCKLEIMKKHQDTVIGDYLQSVHYFDEALGVFIEELKLAGIYDDSLIAIYGDHFAIQRNNKTDDLLADLIGRQYSYQDIMNIPLIITIPNTEIGHTNIKIGSQLDFFPTILNIMGYENKKGLVFGRDLNNFKEENFVAPQSVMEDGSFITDKLVFEFPKTRIYDQGKAINRESGQLEDPGQYRDIYNKIKGEVDLSEILLKSNFLQEFIKN